MKRVLGCVAALLLLASCSHTDSDEIYGKWLFVDEAWEINLDQAELDAFDWSAPVLSDSSITEFTESGKAISHGVLEDVLKVRYRLRGDRLTFITTNFPHWNISRNEVIKLDSDHLILQYTEDEDWGFGTTRFLRRVD